MLQDNYTNTGPSSVVAYGEGRERESRRLADVPTVYEDLSVVIATV